MHRLPVFLAVCLLVLALSHPVLADWVLDGTFVGGRGAAYVGDAISDGAGGAIIVWSELRGTSYDIYIRRIDGAGNPLWTADGVPVCTAINDQVNPVLVSDGAGGAIVAWRDDRSNPDIYAQRIISTGAATWTANGVAICAATGDQIDPQIVSDGAAGAIIAWQDSRSGTNYDIYARRVTFAGVPQWTANGNAVCTLPSFQTGSAAVADGAGGVIVLWSDARNGPVDIFAQRLNSVGTAQWAANGLPVSTAAGSQAGVVAVTDGAGGAIACWYDDRSGVNDIYVQRVNASGAPLWVADGLNICAASDAQGSPSIIADGAGGVIAAWEDFRNGVDINIYAQRITSPGVARWTQNGVAVCTAADSQSQPKLVSDGAQGAIVVWEDERTGTEQDAFGRRIDANGLALWEYDGTPISTAPNTQGGIEPASDGAGGVIVGFSDERSGQPLVYAQRAEFRYGAWGRPEATIKSAVDNPSDQGGKVIVRWTASQHDLYNMPGITFYSIWRATDAVAFAAAQSAGEKRAITDPKAFAREAPATVWSEATPAGPVYWESVGTMDATYLPSYSYTAPTRQDSTIVNFATTYFKILAHEAPGGGARIWESGTVSARSVDNVAPASPLLLAIQQAGSNAVLTWKPVDAPDLDHYTLYRAGANGVRAIPGNFLGDFTLPNHTDPGGAGGNYYYVVTATDIHGNESATSNEVSLSGSTGTNTTPALTVLSVRPNSPNPFATHTELNLGLPREAPVTIELFDISGKRVLSRSLGTLAKGWQRAPLDVTGARGHALASGVYFYRVTAAGETVTHKMVIAR